MTQEIKSIHEHQGKKYLRLIRPADGKGQPILVDVYSVLVAFDVSCPALQHLAKKVLAAGKRGKGSVSEELQGMMAALCRAIDLQSDREYAAEEARKRAEEKVGVKKEPKYMDDVRAMAAQQE